MKTKQAGKAFEKKTASPRSGEAFQFEGLPSALEVFDQQRAHLRKVPEVFVLATTSEKRRGLSARLPMNNYEF